MPLPSRVHGRHQKRKQHFGCSLAFYCGFGNHCGVPGSSICNTNNKISNHHQTHIQFCTSLITFSFFCIFLYCPAFLCFYCLLTWHHVSSWVVCQLAQELWQIWAERWVLLWAERSRVCVCGCACMFVCDVNHVNVCTC